MVSGGQVRQAGDVHSLDRRELLAAAAGALVAGSTLGRVADSAVAAGRDPRAAELARLVSGPVIAPGSSAYGSAKLVYNERFDGVRPLAIVRVQDVKDVQAVIGWAQRNGIAIVPRSGGHSYGGWSTGTGVVVDLGRLRGIRVEDGTAVIGAGRRLIDVYAPLAGKGLTIPAGSCASVALGGLALGGGIGLASRKLGTTSDNIESLRIVTADGRLLTCDAKHNADLFWACRGGGGRNFGIVTDFHVRTAPASTASYFFATWPWSAGPAIIPAWQRWAPNATDDLITLCRLATGVTGPTLQVFGQYFGPEKQLPRLLAPLTKTVPPLRYSSGTSTYLDLMLRWAGCLGQSLAACHLVTQSGTLRRAAFAGKSDYVRKPFSPAAVRTFQRALETRQSAGHGSGAAIMDAYGGAVARIAPDATAFVHRTPLHSIQYLAYWGSPVHQQPSLAWLRAFHDSMGPYVTGGAYVNYADPDLKRWQAAYYGSNYARLVTVKKKYDPDRLFRFPQAIG
jgi:FAD/FMN-containing dehydrogenase